MAFIVKIKFLAGHLERLEYQYLKKNKLRCANKFFGAPALYLTDIVGIEVASEENVKKLGGTIGGALVGGLLMGGVGAIVGAVGSGQTTESTIICTFKDGKKSLAKVNSPMMEALQAHLFNLNQNPHYADGKPKKSLLKKIAIGFAILFVLAALAGKKEESQKNEVATKDPCQNIKTLDDWENKTSSLWRMQNPECKPK